TRYSETWSKEAYFVTRGCHPERGCSSTPTSPCRLHPTDASQVRARATGAAVVGIATGSRQPGNHSADEHGSTPSPPPCFLWYIRRCASACRTALGVVSDRAW